MLKPGSALAAVGGEGICHDAQRRASLATIAVGAVGKHPTAPEALGYQFGIGSVVDEMAGCCDLRAGLPIGQVAAFVRRSGVEL